MASTFEEVVLEWALDQDSIQSLLRLAVEKWSMNKTEALSIIVRMAEKNLIVFYENTGDDKNIQDVDPSVVSEKFVDQRLYTWIGVTDKTIERLNGLREERGS